VGPLYFYRLHFKDKIQKNAQLMPPHPGPLPHKWRRGCDDGIVFIMIFFSHFNLKLLWLAKGSRHSYGFRFEGCFRYGRDAQ
jgi:hypothetical protein